MTPGSICAACGQPGHRYGRNEGAERFDPQACINGLLGRLEEKRTLPGFTECQECGGNGKTLHHNPFAWDPPRDGPDDWSPCPSCSGVGVVPDPETVEKVAEAMAPYEWKRTGGLRETWREIARAALLAYAQHTKETE